MKNKTLKKMMAFTLATFMAFSAVGCGNEDVTNTPATDATSESVAEIVEETPLYNVGTLPIVNEPVTIKILTQDVTGRPFTKAADAGIWAWLEEKTGITIEVESYPAEELTMIWANMLPKVLLKTLLKPMLLLRAQRLPFWASLLKRIVPIQETPRLLIFITSLRSMA